MKMKGLDENLAPFFVLTGPCFTQSSIHPSKIPDKEKWMDG
jgi:hypothetical protein